MADALHKELNGVAESSFKIAKEVRVTKVSETR
jgi:hypothetical protein